MESNFEYINNIEKEKKLPDQIIGIVNETNFGESIDVVPVDNIEIVNQLKNAKIGMDSRVKTKDDEKNKSIFKGLDFDLNKMRSQAFIIYDKNNNEQIPVGVMTIIIAPKWWAKEERYWEKVSDGIVLRDYADLLEKTGNVKEMPDFVIQPAWTKVDPKYLGKFAVPGFRVIKKILDLLSEQAPDNTFIEIKAEGKANQKGKEYLEQLISSLEVGHKLSSEEIDGVDNFVDLMGQNTIGSNSTVKTAELLNVGKVTNFSSGSSLGPIFIKKIK